MDYSYIVARGFVGSLGLPIWCFLDDRIPVLKVVSRSLKKMLSAVGGRGGIIHLCAKCCLFDEKRTAAI